MKLYRFEFTIQGETQAKSKEEAFRAVKQLCNEGFFGPTTNDFEEIEEIPEQSEGEPAGS